ncbi:ribonuclease Y [Microcystis phage MaAM05]|nr:ribonuclease Y [Microcystis phage MaAM05]
MNKFTSGAHELILKRIRDIPSLPDVVNRILAIINQPNTPASEIAKLISYDPGLTSKVLRMVNSAAYGFQRQISSIQHGIMILGFTNVRGLVLSASIFKLFEGHAHPGGLNHQQFWEHSLGTAVAARLLAKSLGVADSDDVFSAGMLHDIGKVVLDVYFKQDYSQVLGQAQLKGLPLHGLPFYHLEESILGVNHASIGNYLASKWKLPVGISEVILHHHQPAQAESCPRLVHLVALANELAVVQYERQGIYNPAHFSPALLDYFGLDDASLEQYLQALKTEMDSAQDLLNAISTR